MIKVRFKANYQDSRPINWPVKHPFWETGYAVDESYSTVISYADTLDYITENWPEAADLEVEQVTEYTFTERFPKPDWFVLTP